MFGKLPELLGKNFAVGYFLPITVFLATNLWLMNDFELLCPQELIKLNTANNMGKLIGVTFFTLVSWLLAIVLLGANRGVLRLMEGYGRFNPLRIFSKIEKSRYNKLQEAAKELNEEKRKLEDSGNELSLEKKEKRNETLRHIAERFPEEERWLLPTSFGNTIRAFEVYPRVMYGLDAIPGWNRLLAVIPKDYNSIVNDAKSIVDFWGNLWLLSWVVFLEYVAFAIYKLEAHIVWFPFVAIMISLYIFSRAQVAAFEWGELVKSSFDVFLPDLYKKLGFPFSEDRKQEKAFWRDFSQAMIYRIPDKIPPRVKDKTPTLSQGDIDPFSKLNILE